MLVLLWFIFLNISLEDTGATKGRSSLNRLQPSPAPIFVHKPETHHAIQLSEKFNKWPPSGDKRMWNY